MVSKTVVNVFDDIDGSENAETVRFAYGDATYEVDLGSKNRDALKAALAPFIAAARSTGSSRRAPRRNDDAAAIRAWASENGVEVSERGRVPQHVRDLYNNR